MYLFSQIPAQACKFFQWVDEPPKSSYPVQPQRKAMRSFNPAAKFRSPVQTTQPAQAATPTAPAKPKLHRANATIAANAVDLENAINQGAAVTPMCAADAKKLTFVENWDLRICMLLSVNIQVGEDDDISETQPL